MSAQCVEAASRSGALTHTFRMPKVLEREQAHPTRFPSAQLDRSPCANLGLSGNVCPIVLGCAVPQQRNGGGEIEPNAMLRSNCTLRWLSGIGFNPSIIVAPRQIRTLGARFGEVEYVGTERAEMNNPHVKCQNRNVAQHQSVIQNTSGSTKLMLLDRDLRVLHRMRVHGNRCIHGRHDITDARLFVARGAPLWMSYHLDWSITLGCKGHWMGQVLLEDGENMHAELKANSHLGGVDIAGRSQALQSMKNGGIIVHPETSAVTHELVDVAPTTLFSLEGKSFMPRMPPTFARSMHNSMHPIWMEELGGYLGVGHRHFGSGSDSNGRAIADAPFRCAHPSMQRIPISSKNKPCAFRCWQVWLQLPTRALLTQSYHICHRSLLPRVLLPSHWQ